MGSSHSGEPNLGNGRSGSSSRKGKKNSISEKPKLPQRGLGVAQLEKIILSNDIMNPTYHLIPSFQYSPYQQTTTNQMELRDMETRNIRYGGPQSTSTTGTRWVTTDGFLEKHEYQAQPSMTRELLSSSIEDLTQKERRQERYNLMDWNNQNLESSESQEVVDLDLKLSL